MKIYVKPSYSIIQLQAEEGIACFESNQGEHGGGGHPGGGHW